MVVKREGDRTQPPDRLGNWALTSALGFILLLAVAQHLDDVAVLASTQGLWLAFWLVLVAVANLLPVTVGNTQLTLDVPILLAVGILFGPTVAAITAVLGAIDIREIRRSISVVRALFNRVQVALSVYLASAAFHAFGTELDEPMRASVAMLVALVIDYGVNVALVGCYLAIRDGSSWRALARQLRIGPLWQFVCTYIGYGATALIFATLSQSPGYWAVLILLVPILLAREGFARWQEAAAATARIGRLERLISRMNRRLLDERRDERTRIAAELHDAALQNVVAMWLAGQRLARLGESSDAHTRRELGALVEAGDNAMSSMRRIIGGLRSSPLGDRGLVGSLNLLVRELRLETQSSIAFRASGAYEELPADLQFSVFFVVREGLLNAVRHASASKIEVSISIGEDGVETTVSDDGCGFERSRVDTENHFGLVLLEERVLLWGGQFQLDTRLGKGTSLRALFPLEGSRDVPRVGTSYASERRRPERAQPQS